MGRITIPVALAAAALLLGGCEQQPAADPLLVEIRAQVKVPAGLPADAAVELIVYQAWSGVGELRHPLAEIERFAVQAGESRLRVSYPSASGEGLVVFAWVDGDADGRFCTPQQRDDVSGLAEVAGFPSSQVNVSLELDTPCAAASWFYPAAGS